MKQTAVEWLIEHLNLDETSPNYNKLIIKQAKEIEKQQIIEAYTFGLGDEYVIGSANYYRNKFNK